MLNQVPDLASDILAEHTFKKLGLPRGIPIETLRDFSFDVSHSMGFVLFGEGRLDSHPAIASVCKALYKNPGLDQLLKSATLWKLAQRRNLIVHRRGIVDTQYLEKTSDKQPVGSKLIVTSQDIERDLAEVKDVGLLIAHSAAIAGN